MDNGFIVLSRDFFIGKGINMAGYINPMNPSQCIKIRIREIRDYYLEMNYRKSRQLRRLPQSSLMVKYYGEVETNLGTGYVYERVADYDGSTSLSIHDLVQLEVLAREKGCSLKETAGTEKEIPCVKDAIVKLYEGILQDRVIVHDYSCCNFMVQFSTPTSWRIRIIDGLGYRVLIPLVYYIDYFSVRQIRRFRLRFINSFTTLQYPGFFSEEEIESLKISLNEQLSINHHNLRR